MVRSHALGLALLVVSFAAPVRAQETLRLALPDKQHYDWFGRAVDIHGDVGLVTRFDFGARRGAGHLFDLTSGVELLQVDPISGDMDDRFGLAAALDATRFVISAPVETVNGIPSGSVHLYDRASGAPLGVVVATDPTSGQWYGTSLDADLGVLLVGAPADSSQALFAGSAYLVNLQTGAEIGKLTAPDAAADDFFGASVAIGNGRAVVGASGEDDDAGAAYVFDVASNALLYELRPASLQAGDYFGASVAVDGDRLLVAASSANGMEGEVYVYVLSTGQLLRKIPSPTGEPGQFGQHLDLEGDLAVVGGASGPWRVNLATGDVLEELTACSSDISSVDAAAGGGRFLVGWPVETHDDVDNAGAAYIFGEQPTLGTGYCGPANKNSTGSEASLDASGCASVERNAFTLEGSGMPVGEFGYPIVSRDAGFVPFPPGSQGNLCLGGTIGRVKSEAKQSDAGGAASYAIDLQSVPQGAGNVAVQPGETWRFQVWFRDQNPGPTSNFTDGLEVLFF